MSADAYAEGSNSNTCATISKAGTSMATPVAAGNAALIKQYFEDEKFYAHYCDASYVMCQKGAFSPSGE